MFVISWLIVVVYQLWVEGAIYAAADLSSVTLVAHEATEVPSEVEVGASGVPQTRLGNFLFKACLYLGWLKKHRTFVVAIICGIY